MSSVVISGDTSGAITIAAPAVAGTYTQTLPQITGTLGTLNSGTAVASTSGTSIDFTSIPANVRRITVMFNQVSVSGTSNKLIQIGAGSVTSTGYVSSGGGMSSGGTGVATSTSGFVIQSDNAATGVTGNMIINLISGNTWVSSHSATYSTTAVATGGGTVALGGTLDRVRITTVNGTDTFDAGSINILYE
jgi:hypothetical protein